jgi:hypothetical protein
MNADDILGWIIAAWKYVVLKTEISLIPAPDHPGIVADVSSGPWDHQDNQPTFS